MTARTVTDSGAHAADAILARAAWRLIPVMALMYVVSYLDRVNIGFAALAMNRDLGLTPEIFGFGSGIFFFGYFFFEVPSNLMLEKVGARAWMCRIMVTWGLLSMACAFVQGPLSFYVLRFALGAAEAGLFPGMLLYMTYWFPAATRARVIALFLAAVPGANVIGAPVSGWLLGFEGALHGWQWLLLLEGAPALLLGVALLWLLPDGPQRAAWLTDAEKAIIAARLADDRRNDAATGALHGFWEMVFDRRIWLFVVPGLGIVVSLYGLNLWMPQMVKSLGFTNLQTGFVVMVPYFVSMIVMLFWGASSDRRNERAWHAAIGAFVGAAGLAGAMLTHAPALTIAAFCLSASGIYSAYAVFWTMPSTFLRGTAAAGGMALLNSIINLGGFLGPSIMGWLLQTTGSYQAGMQTLGGFLAIAGATILVIGKVLFGKLDSAGTN